MARKKPCEFCEDEHFESMDGSNHHQLYIEVYPFNNFIGFTSYATGADEETEELYGQLEMNYCPVCGRKLE